MNADPLELQKFSELAHRWWDPQSEFRPLHEINPLRLEWINARAPLHGKRALDVGCGAGSDADNTWDRVLNVAVIEVAATPEQEVVHGLVRLPSEISVGRLG